MGSCFAESLGEKLVNLKYDALVNTHGVIFNPPALFDLMYKVLTNHKRPEAEYFYNDKLYRHFSASSKLCASDLKTTQNNFARADHLLKNQLEKCNYIFITLGTAWVYHTNPKELPVANCHKLPRNNFEKLLADSTHMKRVFERFQSALEKVNPDAQIVITVSPVRHLRDGMIENNRSKARLIEFAHQCVENSNRVHYWPAYELIIDDLRDYRFYKDDMVHPTKKAVDYIWQYFSKSFFTHQDIELNHELNKIHFLQKVNGGSDQNQTREKIDALEVKYKIPLSNWH